MKCSTVKSTICYEVKFSREKTSLLSWPQCPVSNTLLLIIIQIWCIPCTGWQSRDCTWNSLEGRDSKNSPRASCPVTAFPFHTSVALSRYSRVRFWKHRFSITKPLNRSAHTLLEPNMRWAYPSSLVHAVIIDIDELFRVSAWLIHQSPEVLIGTEHSYETYLRKYLDECWHRWTLTTVEAMLLNVHFTDLPPKVCDVQSF